jgi:hypothetical protein
VDISARSVLVNSGVVPPNEGDRMSQRTNWQYKRLRVPAGNEKDQLETFENSMRALGQDGWELVTVEDSIAYFKRPDEGKTLGGTA